MTNISRILIRYSTYNSQFSTFFINGNCRSINCIIKSFCKFNVSICCNARSCCNCKCNIIYSKSIWKLTSRTNDTNRFSVKKIMLCSQSDNIFITTVTIRSNTINTCRTSLDRERLLTTRHWILCIVWHDNTCRILSYNSCLRDENTKLIVCSSTNSITFNYVFWWSTSICLAKKIQITCRSNTSNNISLCYIN